MKTNESPDEKLKRLFDELGEEKLPTTPNPWGAVQSRLLKQETKQKQQGAFSMSDISSPSSQRPPGRTQPATNIFGKNRLWQGALAGLTGLMLILIIVVALAALDSSKAGLPGANPNQTKANPVVPATATATLARPTNTAVPATPGPTLAQPTATPQLTAAPTSTPTKLAISPTPTARQVTAGTVAPTIPPATTQAQFRQQALALLGAGWQVKESGTIEFEGTRFYVLAYKPADPRYIQQFSSNQIVSASEAAIVQQDSKGQPYLALNVSVKERILRTSKVCLSKLPEDSALPGGIKLAGLAIPNGYTPPAGITVQLNVVWVDPEGTPLNQGLGAYWDTTQQDYRLYIADYIKELRPEYCK